ncbi:threonine-phosphate decarboxylase [Alkalilimnicola ehrlichii]|uniref:threonine-phosphate decarboxylase n=1 Tax=Alkalilimnicola ehrlichii TaxID=351052 RepID=A0A3E0WPH6_9GAMM|nr:threonine-phosphate decarboxylase CobD [Alkalilimnicola ehrlichii]RFA26842.1 threonine-phosphate decarboxylase [Alkalilimnicola ehrlichii]RFA33937.1 threonine-phosphate decarboxylase [Alkalilimnicola ehrlichii]
MLEHGGQVKAAAARYGIAEADWLDLSTGINPRGYPVPPLTAAVWNRLPEADAELQASAAAYYQTTAPLAVPGSQSALQLLPRLRASSRVGVLAPTYNEHAAAWHRAGHTVVELPDLAAADAALPTLDVLIAVNPNNPTGRVIPRQTLERWHAALAAREGWLLVDEAFADADPRESLTPACPSRGLIVLRSLGKFFGLAGLRVGFVLAEASLRQQLAAELGPWSVSGPAQRVAQVALDDRHWQQRTRDRLLRDSQRLQRMLSASGLSPSGGSALFQWVEHPAAERIFERCAEQGILLRRFREPASLRIGLPGSPSDWQRLDKALRKIDH